MIADPVACPRVVEAGVRELKRNGIHMHANFILGFPGDVPEIATRIAEFVDRLEIEFFYASPWYHSPTAPIAREEAKYGIQGRYFAWKHDTMDVDEATALETQLQHATRVSLFASELTQNAFWGQLLFYCNGYDLAETRQVVATYDAFAGRDTSASALRDDPRIVALRALLAAKPLTEPPGVEQATGFAPARNPAIAAAPRTN